VQNQNLASSSIRSFTATVWERRGKHPTTHALMARQSSYMSKNPFFVFEKNKNH